MRPGGRLVVPLTFQTSIMTYGFGAMVRIERTSGTALAARLFSQVGIYPCSIARDPAHEVELRRLMNPVDRRRVTSLVTEPHERGEACVVHVPGFCLQG